MLRRQYLRKGQGFKGFPHSSVGKECACNAGDLGSTPGSGRSPVEGKATHSSILACRIPWTEEPDRSQRVHEVTKSPAHAYLG